MLASAHPNPSPASAGKPDKPLKAYAYAFTPMVIARHPPAAPPISAAANGFLKRMLIPYIAGSDTPIRALKEVDKARVRVFLLRERRNTPKAAPACPKFATNMSGLMGSKPRRVMLLIMMGTST